MMNLLLCFIDTVGWQQECRALRALDTTLCCLRNPTERVPSAASKSMVYFRFMFTLMFPVKLL